MRAIIIDDERLARAELKKLLQDFPEIEVIDEAANAEEGISKIEKFNGSNIAFWRSQIEDYLYQKDLYQPVLGKEKRAEEGQI